MSPRKHIVMHVARRDATRMDRWIVGKAPRLGWYARPIDHQVYADVRTHRKQIYFRTWRDAISYALRRVYGR